MGGAGRVDRQALGVAHVGQVTEQLQALDKLFAGCRAAFNPKAQDSSGSFGQVFLGGGKIRAVF